MPTVTETWLQVMDMFVEQTHMVEAHRQGESDKPLRYTDTRVDEQEREMSLKMVPVTLALESSTTKSYLFNLLDTPGGLLFETLSQPEQDSPSSLAPWPSWGGQ